MKKWKWIGGRGYDLKGSILIFLLVALLVDGVIPFLRIPLVILLIAEILYGLKIGALLSSVSRVFKGKFEKSFDALVRNTLSIVVPTVAIFHTFEVINFSFWTMLLGLYALSIGFGMFKGFAK